MPGAETALAIYPHCIEPCRDRTDTQTLQTRLLATYRSYAAKAWDLIWAHNLIPFTQNSLKKLITSPSNTPNWALWWYLPTWAFDTSSRGGGCAVPRIAKRYKKSIYLQLCCNYFAIIISVLVTRCWILCGTSSRGRTRWPGNSVKFTAYRQFYIRNMQSG